MYAYIDETGDRGSSTTASPIFGMAAVLVDEAGVQELQQAVLEIRQQFGVPQGTVMSWKNHVKNHDYRRFVAARLGAVTNIRVMYIYCRDCDGYPRINISKARRPICTAAF